jgi:hypothetical protein
MATEITIEGAPARGFVSGLRDTFNELGAREDCSPDLANAWAYYRSHRDEIEEQIAGNADVS